MLGFSTLLRKKVARRLPVGKLRILAVRPILFNTPIYPESLLFSIDWKVPILSQIESSLLETNPLTWRAKIYEVSLSALVG